MPSVKKRTLASIPVIGPPANEVIHVNDKEQDHCVPRALPFVFEKRHSTRSDLGYTSNVEDTLRPQTERVTFESHRGALGNRPNGGQFC